jgi:hypothetical protein
MVVMIMALSLLGCRQSSIPTGPPNATPSSGTPRYSFEIRSDSGTIQKSLSGNFDATIGSVRLRVQDGALTVDGKQYGNIRGDDAVLIESDGQVLVNLQVREPR